MQRSSLFSNSMLNLPVGRCPFQDCWIGRTSNSSSATTELTSTPFDHDAPVLHLLLTQTCSSFLTQTFLAVCYSSFRRLSLRVTLLPNFLDQTSEAMCSSSSLAESPSSQSSHTGCSSASSSPFAPNFHQTHSSLISAERKIIPSRGVGGVVYWDTMSC